MTLQELLIALIEEAPSRGIGATDIYIGDEEEGESYKIVGISNNGSNDAVFIRIEKEYFT